MDSAGLEKLRPKPKPSTGRNENDEDETGGSSRMWWECCCRLVFLFVLIVGIVLLIVDFVTTQIIQTSVLKFLEWLGGHPVLGILAVIGIFTLATVLFMPANLLTIGTGFAFRTAFGNYKKAVLLGSITVLLGSAIGSICSFLLGRYLFRDLALHFAAKYPMFRAIDSALEGNGLKIMILLRLSPLIPYNILDYLSGVTAIALWQFIVALIGMLPGTVMFCAIGAAASSLADGEKWVEENRVVRISAICGGLLFTIVGVAVASYYSKIELEKILWEQQEMEGIGVDESLDAMDRRLEMESGEVDEEE
ncbi:hypothetical protein ACA910_014433 [Epithemia clementina (nom. ined.)]